MFKASYSDKSLVVRILSESFDDNNSVNYIIPQDKKRPLRINALMGYSFELCYDFGKVFLSDDKKACALVLLPDQKKVNFKSILLDLKLLFYCIGISNIGKAMARETKIKKLKPQVPMYYLWFIGVDPENQNTGIGTILMNAIKCPPNVPHWHGASSDTKFVQVAITGREKGETKWLEAVTDKEYESEPSI